MSISGFVFVYFSFSSDLFPGLRNQGVEINEKKVTLAHVLDKFFAAKGISPQVRAQYETLVFLTDANGSPVFHRERDTPELRATALNVRTAVVSNYTRVEVAMLKITADQQRDRDVAEQVDELLKSIEQRGKNAQAEDSQAVKGSNNNANDNNDENQNSATSLLIQQENKRKAMLLARRVPLRINLNTLVAPTGGDGSSNEETSPNSSACVLCNFPIRRTAGTQKRKSECPNPNSKGRCENACCDLCFDFAFNVKMMGMKCPVCGGDNLTKDETGGSSSGNTAIGARRDGLEILETKTSKVRRIEAE